MLEVVNRRPKRVNSVISNTYSTIRAIYNLIKLDPRFKRIFFILYDLYSLQLLIKDLSLNVEVIKRVLIKA